VWCSRVRSARACSGLGRALCPATRLACALWHFTILIVGEDVRPVDDAVGHVGAWVGVANVEPRCFIALPVKFAQLPVKFD